VTRRLDDADVLAIWEAGARASAPERALATLERALPDEREELAAWPVGRRDGRLLDVHAATFGEGIAAVVVCPSCDEPLELDFRAEEVRAAEGDSGTVLELAAGRRTVRFRLPTAGDLAAVARVPSLQDARRRLAERCLVDRPARLSERTLAGMAELIAASDPQSDLRFDLECPDCGHAWQAVFDIAAFLWRELEGRARHLLADVHVLALAYGWSEREILELPPSRRLLYLELVGAA
jgi:hypothetical protein